MPASASAICWASVAGTDTGDMAPISRNGVITTGWPARTYSNIAREHAVVVAQRRVDVDQRDRSPGLRSIASRPPNRISAHRDRVDRVRARGDRAHVRTCRSASAARSTMSRWRESSGASFGSQMVPPAESSCGNDCDSLAEAARSRPSSPRGARRPRARTAARRPTRTPCGRRRGGRCARGCGPGRRTRCGAFATCSMHEVGVEADVLALGLLPGRGEQLDGLGQDELDADLGHDPPPAAVEGRDRLLGEDLVARHPVDEHAPRLRLQDLAVCGTSVPHAESERNADRNPVDRPRRAAARPASWRATEPIERRRAGRGVPDCPRARSRRAISALERRGPAAARRARGGVRPGPVLLGLARRGVADDDLVGARRAELRAPRRARPARRSTWRCRRRSASSDLAQVDSRHFLGTRELGRPPGAAMRRRPSARCSSRSAPHPARRSSVHAARSPSRQLEALVRARGYAVAVGELEPGLAAVAAPVRDAGGEIVAALTISGPELRLTTSALAELATGARRRGRRPLGASSATAP